MAHSIKVLNESRRREKAAARALAEEARQRNRTHEVKDMEVTLEPSTVKTAPAR